MAELKSSGRQYGAPSAPDLSGAAAPYKAIGDVVKGVSLTAGEMVARKRKAALEMESSFNVLEGKRSLQMQLHQARQNNRPNEESIIEFNKTQNEIINSILQNTSPQKQKEVQLQLMEQARRNEYRYLRHVGSARKKMLKESDAAMYYEGSKQAFESAATGDLEGALQTINQIGQARSSLVEAGELTQTELMQGQDSMVQAAINGHVDFQYNQAWLNGGERAAAQFVKQFWEDEQPNITQAQKNEAFKHLRNTATHERTSIAQVSKIGYHDVMDDIYSAKRPADESQLQTLIKKSAESGFPLNGMDAFKATQAWRKGNNKGLKRDQSNLEINSYVASGNMAALIDAGPSKVNDYFIDTRKVLMQRAIDESQSSATDAEAVMNTKEPWMISAAIAVETPVPISQLQDEMHTQLASQNPDDILAAVNIYDYVKDKNPVALDGFSQKDLSFMRAVSRSLKDTQQNPGDVINKYKESILNITPEQKKNRDDSYNEFIKNNPTYVNRIVEKAFGRKAGSTVAGPSATLYASVQKQFKEEYGLSGDENQARDAVIDYMKANGGESMYARKNEIVWNPPEKLPFNDFGNIVRNQASKHVQELIDNAQKNPGVLPYTIERSDKMPEFPAEFSEQDMMDGKYDKGEWWLKIDGEDRRVYFVSPNYNQSNAFNRTQYQVMYEKNGRLQNLMSVQPSMNPDGSVRMSASKSLMTFYGPHEFVPNVVKNMQAEDADKAMERGASKAATKRLVEEDFIVDGWIFNDRKDSAVVRHQQIIEDEKSKVGERLQAEKVRRQQIATKEYLQMNGEGP